MKQGNILSTMLLLLLAIAHANGQTNSIKMDTLTANEIKNFRSFFDNLGNIYPPAKDVKIENEKIEDVNCYWFTPATIHSDKVLLYLHGGSLAAGSVNSHRALVSHIATKLQAKILFVEYALAPEHPFPAGMNDVVNVYKSLVTNKRAAKIALMGDSAGGGILLSFLGEIQSIKTIQPIGIIMISPWLDLNCSNASYETNKKSDPILKKEDLKKFADYYSSGNSSSNPWNVKLKNPPPSFLMVAANEILVDDSKKLYERLKEKQKSTTIRIYENQTHVWVLSNITSSASQETLEDVKAFFEKL